MSLTQEVFRRRRAREDVVECMVNTDDDDEYDQAADALVKLFDDEEEEGELDDDVEWFSFFVLCQMYRDLDNKSLQKRGRKVLRQLENFRERYDYLWDLLPVRDAIVEFIEIHVADASAARFGLALISRGEIPTLNRHGDWKITEHIVNVALDCMVLHENDPVVQEYAMLVIDDVDENLDVDYRTFLDVCLKAMHNHPNNSNVQVAACESLRLFRDLYELITRVEWPPATILQALNNHVHCAEVQTSACGCLEALLGCEQHGRYYIEEELPTVVGEEFFLAGRDYIEAILQAMQNHPSNEGVQISALRVLNYMTDESTNLNRIIQGGGVDLVIRAMRISFLAVERLTPVQILKPLLGYSTDARREAIELGAIPMLLDVLRGLPSEVSIPISWCIIVCDALNELFLENIDNAVGFQIANEGGIKLIFDWFIKHVRAGSSPSSGTINRFHHELKDDDILAHLAMFFDCDGKLPLHHAADWVPSSEGQMAILEHLLKVYPEAATVRDGSGRLPLHIAIESRAPLSVLEVLLRATPDIGEAVCRRRDDTVLNFPPVLMAAASDCDLECIFALLRYAPEITQREVVFISRKRKSPPV